MHQDNLLNEFIQFDENLSVKSDTVAVTVTCELIPRSSVLENTSNLRRSASDPMIYTYFDNNSDELSLHPSEVDSLIIEQESDSVEYDRVDQNMSPTPRHTTDSFVSVGALMAKTQFPLLEVIVPASTVDNDPASRSVLSALFRILRLTLAGTGLTLQLLLQTIELSFRVAKWFLFLAFNISKFLFTCHLAQLAFGITALVAILGTSDFAFMFGSRDYSVCEQNAISPPLSDCSIPVFEEHASIQIQVETDLISFAVATFQSLVSTARGGGFIEHYLGPDVQLHLVVPQLIETAFFFSGAMAFCLFVVTKLRNGCKVPAVKHSTSKATTTSIDYCSPLNFSALSELESQLLCLGCDKSADHNDQIRCLIKVRMELYNAMKRDDLRVILKDHGMSPSGLKKDLAKRLAEQWSLVPLPLSKKEMAKSLIGTRRQLFGECKANDLQQLLKAHGMSPSGNKLELIQRLAESYGTVDVPKTC